MSDDKGIEAPGPGTWMGGGAWVDRPLARYGAERWPEPYMAGFTDAMADFGLPVETNKLAVVKGFFFNQITPLKLPPDHPEMQKRLARCAETLATKGWREDARRFREETLPEVTRRHHELSSVTPSELDDEALAHHVETCDRAYRDAVYEHHRLACTMSIPVGRFLVKLGQWTGATPAEGLALMRGASPTSRGAFAELDAVAAALADAPAWRDRLGTDEPAAFLDALAAAEGPVGDAGRDWLLACGTRVVTGFDISDLSARELPGMMVKCLRERLAPQTRATENDVASRTAALRERAPEEAREAFDELLEEARHVYGLRDERNDVLDAWALGLMRRAAREAGTRLVKRGSLQAEDHIFELTAAETAGMLRGAPCDAVALAPTLAAQRKRLRIADMPPFLGPPPAGPPPIDCMPPPWRDAMGGMMAYVHGMIGPPPKGPKPEGLKGLPASAGRTRGPVRIVRAMEDFARVEAGDVLVAPITTPAYNVLLPLLGAVVTERGGLLSHPAIVAREYGIPAVVACRGAVAALEEGTVVEVDGDAGTVTAVAS